MEKPLALIIEDDRDTVALFRHVLDLANYRTEIVLHGNVAKERLETSKPDVVLLDLNLPGASGVELLEMIRGDERLKDVPVVVITAHAHVAESLPVEPDLVLFKPVNIEQLSNLVTRLSPTEKTIDEPPRDEVTHLYNRSFFMSRLAYSLERAKQLSSNQFAVLFMDLDQFKKVNEQYEEGYGDEILKETAIFLRTTLRPTDTISRFEYDHFMFLIEDITNQEVPVKIAKRIQDGLSVHLAGLEKPVEMSTSIGIVLCDEVYEDKEAILRDADTALFLAKADGGGCYKVYDRETLENLRNIGKVSRLGDEEA